MEAWRGKARPEHCSAKPWATKRPIKAHGEERGCGSPRMEEVDRKGEGTLVPS